MTYDLDHDGQAEVIECANYQTGIKYMNGEDFNGYNNAHSADWQYMTFEEAGLQFSSVFGVKGCTIKDCTHGRRDGGHGIYDCVTGGPDCRDWLNGLAIQCYCGKTCAPHPPPSPPPIICEELVPNGGTCG